MDKKEFINKFANETKPKTVNESTALLLRYINLAKKEGISFTREEILSIYEKMSKDLPANEKEYANKIIRMLNI